MSQSESALEQKPGSEVEENPKVDLLARDVVAKKLGMCVRTLARKRKQNLVPDPVSRLSSRPQWRRVDIDLYLAVDCDMKRFLRAKRDRDRAIRQRQIGIIPSKSSV